MSTRHRSSYFFFFQAEDGIRDVAVTGVQTCALPISRASGPAPAAAPAAPSAARRAGTAPRAPPGTPRTPPRAAAPTRTLPRPRAPRRHPSCSTSSCDSFIEHPPQPDVGARQLRLGKTHRLAHPLRDLLVRVALDIVQPYHRTRGLAQPLECPFEIDLRRHAAGAHAPRPSHRPPANPVACPHPRPRPPHRN